MTWREALLAYQINNKERALEDIKYELRGLEEQNMRAHERNERLMQEQSVYLKNLLKQAKEYDKKVAEEREIDKTEVVTVMMDKWEAAKVQEKEVAILKEQIARKEAQIIQEEKQVEYWQEYEEHGRHEHLKQIKLLEQELIDMETSFTEMRGHIERSLNQAKDEITEHTDQTLDNQKYLATENAMARLDKNSRQEVLDNDWLKREVELHTKEADELLSEVEQIEKANLDIMSELFECTVDDLKISRNFYLTQFGENDDLEDGGVLEMDLAKMSLPSSTTKAITEHGERPESVMEIITKKVKSLGPGHIPIVDEHLDSDETDESDYDGENAEENVDPFTSFFNLENEEYGDFLQLGPLELKLLNITGKRMTIYQLEEEPSKKGKADSFQSTDWPVTQPMLKEATTPRS